MAKFAHEKQQQDRELLDSINVDHGLSNWEAEFVDSMLHQLKAGGVLTDKQRQCALRIQLKLDQRASR
jgi:hypothetical protein